MDDKKIVSRFKLSFNKLIEGLKYINQNYKILQICDPLISSAFVDSHVPNEDPSGINSLRILSNGNITPSTYLISNNFVIDNIKTSKVLQNIKCNMIERIIPKDCKDCKYKESCSGGVFDRRYLWYKTFEARDPYCPYRAENYDADLNIKLSSDDSFQSIHDGYLPTMFFKN